VVLPPQGVLNAEEANHDFLWCFHKEVPAKRG